MTDSVENILPRKLEIEQQKLLDSYADGLEEVVNFGTHILKWDYTRKDGSDEMLPGALFLRNLLEEVDAISILIRNSAFDSAKSLIRTALENLFYLKYLFQRDTYNRSMSFLVWDAINQHSWINKFDSTKQKGKEFKAKLAKDKFLNNFKFPDSEVLEKYRKHNNDLLELEAYKKIKLEYYRTKNSSKFKKTPNWYSLFDGPKNLEALASSIGYPAIYDIFYRSYSKSTHGNDILQGRITLSESGQPEIFQIRFPGEMQLVIINTYSVAILAYIAFCKARLPDKYEAFQDWYKSIRQTFVDIEKININIK